MVVRYMGPHPESESAFPRSVRDLGVKLRLTRTSEGKGPDRFSRRMREGERCGSPTSLKLEMEFVNSAGGNGPVRVRRSAEACDCDGAVPGARPGTVALAP